jgi:hypothetical protein
MKAKKVVATILNASAIERISKTCLRLFGYHNGSWLGYSLLFSKIVLHKS